MENIVLCNFFFCHYVFKKLSAVKASESIYMRERVKLIMLNVCLLETQNPYSCHLCLKFPKAEPSLITGFEPKTFGKIGCCLQAADNTGNNVKTGEFLKNNNFLQSQDDFNNVKLHSIRFSGIKSTYLPKLFSF